MIKVLISLLIVCNILLITLFINNKNLLKKLKEISKILDDIDAGNTHHKILTNPKDKIANICFKINAIIHKQNVQIAELEKKEKVHKKLLTSLSHDLRTPLSSLIGYLDAMDENYIPLDKRDEYTRIAKNKAYDLKRFVDTLFDWFKLDSREMPFIFEETDINELSRSIIADFIPILEQNKIKYDISIMDSELYKKLDIKAYSRIINNLIENIISHSLCTLFKFSIDDIDDTITIKISDNGIGIEEKDLPYIFDRLYKCDTARTSKSSGLGLSITKALVEINGGLINVSSTKNNGVTFTIIFPK